jgi:hypothetical protein
MVPLEEIMLPTHLTLVITLNTVGEEAEAVT